MKYLFIILFNVLAFISEGQTKPGTSFYENETKDLTVCPESLSALADTEVENLLKEMLEGFSLKMSYIIVSCPQIDNCQAMIYKGKPYILYNATFLDEVKRLNFSQKELPTSDKNWKALTILAHELGHHLNNHLSNPLPGMSNIDLELGADKTAGFIIYTMGGTIAQAQLAFNDIPEADSYTHPGKQKRLDAVEKGWNDAMKKYPKYATQNEMSAITDIDDNYYKTVKIGNQVWMQSNLEVTHYRNGDLIPQVQDPGKWNSLTSGAWCWYENDETNGKKYGKLYNWYAVNDSRGLAMEGWHMPSKDEYLSLSSYLGGMEKAGGKMIAIKYWDEAKSGANNSSGFTGLPGGFRNGGMFLSRGVNCYLWSSSEASYSDAWYYVLRGSDLNLVEMNRPKELAILFVV